MTNAKLLGELVDLSARLQSLYFRVRTERPEVGKALLLAAVDISEAVCIAANDPVAAEVTP